MTNNKAKFLEGDLMRHVAVMSFSASAGLLSIFLVDFVDLYFISMLGDVSKTAGVGFAGTLLYFNMSLAIGLMIAMSALAARRIGRDDAAGAREIATNVLVLGTGFSLVFCTLFWIFTPQLLDIVGATGDAKANAVRYLRIVVPSMPVMMIGIICSGLLRAHGDARRAMNATLAAGIVNAVLDPILIFGLGLGLDGAAYASIAARLTTVFFSVTPLLRHYGGFAPFVRMKFLRDLPKILTIAVPAVLTNVATPVGAIIVTRAIAPFGEAAIAGTAVVSRLTPLVFCVVFALSGAVGPIIGQNFGALSYDRVRGTLKNALVFTATYTGVMWIIMLLASGMIATQFALEGVGRDMVAVFAVVVTPLFFFNGVLFIANASFNNLGRPTWSTILNWGKNSLGLVPFVWLGAKWGGASGVLIGQAIGGIVFATVGIVLVFRLVGQYESGKLKVED